MTARLKALLYFQSGYYFVTGFWPIVSIGTFQLVTGPKIDLWLVKMVGLLAMVIGATIGFHAWSGRRSTELLVLSFGSIAAFTLIDTIYALSGVISKIYLADAAVEIGLALVLVLSYGPPGRGEDRGSVPP